MDTLGSTSTIPGWTPTPSAKRLLLEEFRGALYGGDLMIRSEEVLAETLSFVYTNIGKVDHDRIALEDDPAGSGENHGDRVIAAALMWRAGKDRTVRLVRQDEAPPLAHPGSLAGRRQMSDTFRHEQESWA